MLRIVSSGSEFWTRLQGDVAKGSVVRNWTAKNGYVGDTFTITRVSSTHVDVDTPGAKSVQHIPRADIESVHARWAAYCAGSVQRQAIRDTTRFSKYIISILRQLDTQKSGTR